MSMMLPVAIVAAVVLVVILGVVLAGFVKRTSASRSFERAGGLAGEDILKRLQSAAFALGGSIVRGPALETPSGRLALLATRAPQVAEIDVAKFTVTLTSPHALTVIPVQDAAKALQAKNLRAVQPDDPGVAADYKVFASDEAFARKVATPGLVGRLRELDKAVNARARLQVAPHGATVLVERGLDRPEDLKVFHDGSAAVIEEFRRLIK
jgi:hypothetical protein